MPHGDRPEVTLTPQPDGLKVTWAPTHGAWGKFKNEPASGFVDVVINEWWLYVGTKPLPSQPHEGSQVEIVSQSVGNTTEFVVPQHLLPINKQVIVYVIGYFDSKNVHGEDIVEGIYSDEKHIVIH